MTPLKKIILTTDQYLIKDGVQEIDNEFLEWFVNNSSCEEVETYHVGYADVYNIIIPKEEPKQENCCTPIGQIKRYKDCIGWDKKPKQDTNPQDLIGRKVRGFRFNGSREAMDKYIGQIGIITVVDSSSCRVEFKDEFWFYPTYSIHEHLVEEEKVKPHSFCKETGENCTMSYCDDNGCQERKRNLVEVDTSEQNVDTSPQIIDLSNVDGVEMMVSDDGKRWFKEIVIAKHACSFIDCNCCSWNYAKPIEPVKKVTMKEVEEVFGCRVEIVKED